MQNTSAERKSSFFRILISETLNTTASSVLTIATPLIAITTLHADATQVGILAASGTAAPLLFGLSAGALADRWDRKKILFWCGFARLLIVGLVPVLIYFGQLGIVLLCLISFALSGVKLLFDSVVAAVIPTIVHRNNLTKANSWFEAINSTATALGPAIAGGLVQAVSATSVFVLNAVIYLCSTISLKGASIQPASPGAKVDQSHLSDICAGIRLLWESEIQRFIAIAAGAFNLFHTAFFTVFTLFSLKQLEFSAAMFGTMVSVVSVFGLLGAICAPRLVEALGPRTTLVGSLLIIGPLGIPILLAEALPFPYRAAVIAASIAAWDFAIVVHVIVEQTVRQTMIENRHLARVTATVRFVSWGADPIGALLGGLAASSVLGARGTLLFCLIGFTASGALLLLSRRIRRLTRIDLDSEREMLEKIDR